MTRIRTLRLSSAPVSSSSATRAFNLPSRLLFRQAFWKPMCTLGRFHQLPRLGSCGMSHACTQMIKFGGLWSALSTGP